MATRASPGSLTKALPCLAALGPPRAQLRTSNSRFPETPSESCERAAPLTSSAARAAGCASPCLFPMAPHGSFRARELPLPATHRRLHRHGAGRIPILVLPSEDTESKPRATLRSGNRPCTFSSDLTAILTACFSGTRASQSPISPLFPVALPHQFLRQPARSQNRPSPPTSPIPAHQNHDSTQNRPSRDSARAAV